MCDHCVLADMEVEHADIGEIGAIFKCELKALLRVYGTGSQDFKRNLGFLDISEELDCLFRLGAPHIVMGRQAMFGAFGFRCGRPIVAAMQGLHIEVNIDARLFKDYWHFD
jgi:hypothetical protein